MVENIDGSKVSYILCGQQGGGGPKKGIEKVDYKLRESFVLDKTNRTVSSTKLLYRKIFSYIIETLL